MDEITFVDVLTHYQMKLAEASDELELIKKEIKKAEGHIEAGWAGDAADACQAKLEMIYSEIVKAMAETSEAIIKLSAIGEDLASEELSLV